MEWLLLKPPPKLAPLSSRFMLRSIPGRPAMAIALYFQHKVHPVLYPMWIEGEI
uniref:Uncharacterized protein n=1 Tax=Octopus bimaculoides TaxID=37653 RepID=A0A0L8G7A7_OCTBM